MSKPKSLFVCLLIICLSLSLTACSAQSGGPEPTVAPTTPPEWESRPEETAEPSPTPGIDPAQTASPAATPAPASTPEAQADQPDASDLLAREIPGQCFNTEFDGWGKVRFSSIQPASAGEDVRFILTDNGKLLYSFPDTSPDNKLEGVEFGEILAVSFKDFDKDGRADVTVHLSYETNAGVYYNSVRVYSQKSSQRGFSLDKYGYDIARYVIINGYTGSIESVFDGISECLAENGAVEPAASAGEGGETSGDGTETGTQAAAAGSNELSSYAQSELEGLLKSALTYVQPSTSGCTLRATEIAAKMLTWASDNNVSQLFTEDYTEKFVENLEFSEKELFSTSMNLIDYQRKLLQREDNTDILSNIGWENKEIKWGTDPIPAVEGIMTGAGQR